MVCFYHNDEDGRCAGAIVARFENNYNKENFFEVDYIMDLTFLLNQIKQGERVYFVDYSFTEKTKYILDQLIEKDCDVVWIDHHESSLELEENEKLPVRGLRSDEASGAALTYMYLYKCTFEKLPHYVKLVSDYDSVKYQFGLETIYFKIGLNSSNYDALGQVWKNLQQEATYRPKYQVTLNDMIKKGKIIKTYLDEDNRQYRDQFSYESEIAGYRCLVINRKTNPWIFGEKYKEYPIVAVWAFNGNRYCYSIFTDDPNIDCSKIAEAFGGGGNKGAAGFSSDKLLFEAA